MYRHHWRHSFHAALMRRGGFRAVPPAWVWKKALPLSSRPGWKRTLEWAVSSTEEPIPPYRGGWGGAVSPSERSVGVRKRHQAGAVQTLRELGGAVRSRGSAWTPVAGRGCVDDPVASRDPTAWPMTWSPRPPVPRSQPLVRGAHLRHPPPGWNPALLRALGALEFGLGPCVSGTVESADTPARSVGWVNQSNRLSTAERCEDGPSGGPAGDWPALPKQRSL